jgi:hypothetical protein
VTMRKFAGRLSQRKLATGSFCRRQTRSSR